MASVDVIVPCYNYGRFLPQCVGSVLAQRIQDLRVLIIDDASQDDSAEIARQLEKSDGRVELIAHRQNQGHIATYNEGIDWVRADLMLLLSADDLLAPGALGRAVDAFQKHPSMGLLHGKHLEFSEQGGKMIKLRYEPRLRYERRRYIADSDEDLSLSLQKEPDAAEPVVVRGSEFVRRLCQETANPVATVTAIVRGPLQKRVGGYRPDLPHSGDMEMWLRLAANADVGFMPTVQGLSRIHDNNMSLQYLGSRTLPDLQHRQMAFSSFCKYAASLGPVWTEEIVELDQLWRRQLAEEAVWMAGSAIDEGDGKTAREVADLARAVHPDIVRTRHWRKLSIKLLMGAGLWRMIAPSIEKARTLFPAQ